MNVLNNGKVISTSKLHEAREKLFIARRHLMAMYWAIAGNNPCTLKGSERDWHTQQLQSSVIAIDEMLNVTE